METNEQKSYNLKSYIIAAGGVIGGLGLIIASEHIDRLAHPIVYNCAASVATTLLVGGLLGLAYEIALRRELVGHFNRALNTVRIDVANTVDRVDRRIGLAHTIDHIGLDEIEPKESHFDYSDMIISSHKLWFVFNDGRTWFSQHAADIHERLQKPNLVTNIILADTHSPFLDALAVKVDDSKEELQRKVEGTVKLVGKLRTSDHKVTIYGHSMPTTYSLIMNETKAVFIPYPMARKADRIPCFVFSSASEDGFYGMLRRDVAALITHGSTRVLSPDQLV